MVIVHFSDGSKYKGTYKNGKREGSAIEVTKDGTRFEGTYVNDRRDGKFIEKNRDGQIVKKGRYENGRRYEE